MEIIEMIKSQFVLNYSLVGIIKLFLTAIIAIMLGYERQMNGKNAGIRTHSVVALGACLITHIGISMQDGIIGGDPLRMAAQVVSGIGFLGSGIIIKGEFAKSIFDKEGRKRRRYVNGLTTAACVWSAGCIGIGVGAGFIIETYSMVFLTLGIFHMANKLQERLKRLRPESTDTCDSESDE